MALVLSEMKDETMGKEGKDDDARWQLSQFQPQASKCIGALLSNVRRGGEQQDSC